MNTLSPNGSSLSLCMAVTLLAGCGGSQIAGLSATQELANSAGPKSAASPLSGGAFSASYSGHYSVNCTHEG